MGARGTVVKEFEVVRKMGAEVGTVVELIVVEATP